MALFHAWRSCSFLAWPSSPDPSFLFLFLVPSTSASALPSFLPHVWHGARNANVARFVCASASRLSSCFSNHTTRFGPTSPSRRTVDHQLRRFPSHRTPSRRAMPSFRFQGARDARKEHEEARKCARMRLVRRCEMETVERRREKILYEKRPRTLLGSFFSEGWKRRPSHEEGTKGVVETSQRCKCTCLVGWRTKTLRWQTQRHPVALSTPLGRGIPPWKWPALDRVHLKCILIPSRKKSFEKT